MRSVCVFLIDEIQRERSKEREREREIQRERTLSAGVDFYFPIQKSRHSLHRIMVLFSPCLSTVFLLSMGIYVYSMVLWISVHPTRTTTITTTVIHPRPILWVSARLLMTNLVPFQHHPNTLESSLNASYSHNLTHALNSWSLLRSAFHTPLHPITPEEARIQVISPRESALLLKETNITMQEIDAIALNYYIAYAIVSVDCIGYYTQGETEVAYLRAKSVNYARIREEIQREYEHRGGQGGFVANAYQAHIVVGYNGKGMQGVVDERVALDGVCFDTVDLRVGSPFF